MRILPLFVAILLPLSAIAQQTPEPRINAGNTATFTFDDPSATSVSLALEGMKPMRMVKNEAGAWSITTPVLAPQYYEYYFDVDGRHALDPKDLAIKTSYVTTANLFLVKGTPPKPWEPAAAPHGVVHHHAYTSKIVTALDQQQSEYYVYTPPGYDARVKTKYPVLYLLHGWSDTPSVWTAMGHANDIFDSLIAEGKVKPMIVVMPLGYGEMSFVRNGMSVWQDPVRVESNVSLFSQSLLTEVLPQVEQEYSVSARREDRAIAGLSMGGREALSVGFKHADQFAYVGGFSSAVFPQETSKSLGSLDLQKANFKVLWISCGTEDSLITGNRALVADIKAKGVPVNAVETPGMHVWTVWRDNLVNFSPLLFKR